MLVKKIACTLKRKTYKGFQNIAFFCSLDLQFILFLHTMYVYTVCYQILKVNRQNHKTL